MAFNTVPGNKHTEQNMNNWSFDSDFNLNVVEMIGYDPVAGVVRRVTVDPLGNIQGYPLTALFDYSGGSVPVYIGLALPGAATSAASWQIKKFTYDANNNVTAIKYAGGTAQFTNIYDDRASLTYS